MNRTFIIATAAAALLVGCKDSGHTQSKPAPTPPATPTDAQAKARPVDARIAHKAPPADAAVPKPAKRAGHDFITEARVLFHAALCRGKAPLPAVATRAFMTKQCRFLEHWINHYKNGWLKRARPFFAKVVPPIVKSQIVYPFGGGDLLTALVVFPKATEVTTLSLEPSGDPRRIYKINRTQFIKYWDSARDYFHTLLTAIHSRTKDMMKAMNFGRLPGGVIYSLLALAILDMEPTSLRYFAIEPDGTLRYYTDADLSAADAAVKAAKGDKARRKALAARKHMFRNMELRFHKPGDSTIKIHRHIRADLSDKAFAKDDRVLVHLRKKGEVTAMTKAASYLLWYETFSKIRDYLLKHMNWMVSDATGIPPRFARKYGFEQITYGRFKSHIRFMANPGTSTIAEFRKLWESQKHRYLPFRFGYSGGWDFKLWHLMITRKKHSSAN